MNRNTTAIAAWISGALVGYTAALAINMPHAGADTLYYDDDDNVALMQEFIDTVDYVETKYGTPEVTVYTEWMDPNLYATAYPGYINVNKTWSTGVADITADIEGDIAGGYHNPGCSPVRTIALHEMAHIIDAARRMTPRRNLERATAGMTFEPGVLAGYSFDAAGYLDAGEALAEAFQAVECGSANATERELYNILIG